MLNFDVFRNYHIVEEIKDENKITKQALLQVF